MAKPNDILHSSGRVENPNPPVGGSGVSLPTDDLHNIVTILAGLERRITRLENDRWGNP